LSDATYAALAQSNPVLTHANVDSVLGQLNLDDIAAANGITRPDAGQSDTNLGTQPELVNPTPDPVPQPEPSAPQITTTGYPQLDGLIEAAGLTVQGLYDELSHGGLSDATYAALAQSNPLLTHANVDAALGQLNLDDIAAANGIARPDAGQSNANPGTQPEPTDPTPDPVPQPQPEPVNPSPDLTVNLVDGNGNIFGGFTTEGSAPTQTQPAINPPPDPVAQPQPEPINPNVDPQPSAPQPSTPQITTTGDAQIDGIITAAGLTVQGLYDELSQGGLSDASYAAFARLNPLLTHANVDSVLGQLDLSQIEAANGITRSVTATNTTATPVDDSFDTASANLQPTLLDTLLNAAAAADGNGSAQVSGFDTGNVTNNAVANNIDLSQLFSNTTKATVFSAHADSNGVFKLDHAADSHGAAAGSHGDFLRVNGAGGGFSDMLTLHNADTDVATLLANHHAVIGHGG
jgi:hypothetical protein